MPVAFAVPVFFPVMAIGDSRKKAHNLRNIGVKLEFCSLLSTRLGRCVPVCASSKLCKIVIKRKIVSKKLVKGLQLHSSGRCAHIEAQRDPRELLYALGAWLLQPMV